MVTGGESGSTRFDKLDSTEIYKEFDGWQLVPASLPTLMSRFGLAKLNDRIFIFGIIILSVEILKYFQPCTLRWL